MTGHDDLIVLHRVGQDVDAAAAHLRRLRDSDADLEEACDQVRLLLAEVVRTLDVVSGQRRRTRDRDAVVAAHRRSRGEIPRLGWFG